MTTQRAVDQPTITGCAIIMKARQRQEDERRARQQPRFALGERRAS